MIRLISIGVATAVLLGGCDPRFIRETNLSPREIQTLTGTWEGQATLSREDIRGCPTHYIYVLRVANGSVDGELVDRATPNAPRTKFTTFLDYDGSIAAMVRPGGADTTVRGVFQRDSFLGDSSSKGCGHRLRLQRTASS